MAGKLPVYKGRTNRYQVNLGMDVSSDIITSEIRTEPDQSAPLIATWIVSKPNGGADGLIEILLDDSITDAIEDRIGYMDFKRSSGGEPFAVFSEPLEVDFLGTVTI